MTWPSSNTLIATVTSAGLMAGVAASWATITATGEGKSGTPAIAVSNAPAGGHIYYTATTGLDINPGTLASPFKTIAKGASVLQPGDTLYIRGGTYAETLDNNIPSGTSWASPVTVSAYPGETVIVQPAATLIVRFDNPASYVVLANLILDGTKMTALNPCVYINNRYGTGNPNHIRFTGGEFRNCASNGLLIEASLASPTPDYNEIINVKVHDNGRLDPPNTKLPHHGLYIQSSHNLITGCDIYNNPGLGVHIYKDNAVNGVDASYNTVSNNKVHDNAKSGWRGHGIILSGGDRNVAYNNLIWNNQGGIQVDYNASNTSVYNNTIYANNANRGSAGIDLGSSVGARNTTIRNNIVYGNTAGDIKTGSATHTVADHNTLNATNPLFVNAASHDFHLMTGSPAIDAGLAVTGVATDFDGIHRPQGAGYDIGAYEYVQP